MTTATTLLQGNRVLMVIFRIMLMLPDSIKLERATVTVQTW